MKKIIIVALMMLMLTGCGTTKKKEIEVPDVYKASIEAIVNSDLVQGDRLLNLMSTKNMHCVIGVHGED